MAQQFDVLLNIQLQHKKQIKTNIQVSCKWEDHFTELRRALTNRNKFQHCKKPKFVPKPPPTKKKTLLHIREMRNKHLCLVFC